MKQNGTIGLGSGKLGTTVNAIYSGTQVQREYRAHISNPSSTGQVSQRARFKLASQVAAALAPVIAIPKKGMKSARNQFVHNNMPYFFANSGIAEVSYENLQITNSCIGLPGIQAERTNVMMQISLTESAAMVADEVVYCIFKKTSEAKLQLVTTKVVTESQPNGTFYTDVPAVTGDVVIYAYGIKANTDKAKAKYESYNVRTGYDVATLIATRSLNDKDFSITQTRGITLLTNEDTYEPAPTGKVRVFVTLSGQGFARVVGGVEFTGSTRYVDVNYGDTIQLSATAANGSTFSGWWNNGGSAAFSTDNPLSLIVTEPRDIIVMFEKNEWGGLE